MYKLNFYYYIGKDYDELSERHKQRRKKEIKDKVNNFLNGLQNIGLEPVSLQLKTQDEQHISVKLGLESEPACMSFQS